MPPAVTLAGPVLVTAKFAEAVTVVFAIAVLLPETGSAVVEATDAVFVIVVGWPGAVTTMVKAVDDPVFQAARVHDTETLPVLLHVQPPLLGLTETNVTPAGSVSVTLTLAASDGPRFCAVTVYVTLLPATTVAGPVLVTARSADGVTFVVAFAELFPATGSEVVVLMAAVLVIVAPWAGAVTTIVKLVDEPVAQVARVQVTEMLALLLHVQPPLLGVADTNVTPAGKVSNSDTFAASDGPRLLAETV